MVSRITLAAGALGLGALAFVGTGSFASFTSQTPVTNSITSGTFQLQDVAGTTSVSGLLVGDAVNGGQPTQSLATTGEPPLSVGGNGNTVEYTLGNAAPGDSYSYRFSVYDVGTLQGQLNTITYSPGTAGSALLNEMTVQIQEATGSGWSAPIPTAAYQASAACGGCGSAGTPVNASGAYTFMLNNQWGPAFLQPNKLTGTPLAPTYTGEESSATFKVTFSFLDTSGSQNSVQSMHAAPTMSVNGINTP